MARSTINDVASRAGVSVATVSRALRGLPNVSASTRQRVLDAASALQYSADSRASSLASGRTNVIAVAAPDFGSWYVGQTLVGVEMALTEAGYDLLLLAVSRGVDQHRELLSRLKTRRVDGLLVVDFFFGRGNESVLDAIDVPTVVAGEVLEGVTTVTIDNYEGGRLAMDHLLSFGHKRVAFVGGPAPEIRPAAADLPRKQGAVDVLAEAGLELSGDVKADYSIVGGREALASLHAAGEIPTAVFCGSDEIALGVMTKARELGLSVPGDLSVVGFDDHQMAEPLGLTTVRQRVRENGAYAAGLLLKVVSEPDSVHLVDPHAESATASHVAELELVIRPRPVR